MKSDARERVSPPDVLTFGPTHLDVRDVTVSAAFYQEVLGLALRSGGAQGSVALGSDERTLIVLHPGATRPVQKGFSGLYHLAIHVPTETDLAHALVRLRYWRQPVSAVDHLLSKALYLSDPDGIGIELTLETPERGQLLGVDGRGLPMLFDTEGRLHSGREALDLEALPTATSDSSLGGTLPQGTKIGHIHLHVRDLDEAFRFYRDEIGFQEGHVFRGFGMAELHAGGRFQHRLALNVWQGEGAPNRPTGVAGLRSFTVLSTPGLGPEVEADRDYIDPSGNALSMPATRKESENDR